MVLESLSYPEIVEVYTLGNPAKVVPNGDVHHVHYHFCDYRRYKYGKAELFDETFNAVMCGICDGSFPKGFEDEGVRRIIEQSEYVDCSET